MTPVSEDKYLSRTHQYCNVEPLQQDSSVSKDFRLSPLRLNDHSTHAFTGHYRTGSRQSLRVEPLKQTAGPSITESSRGLHPPTYDAQQHQHQHLYSRTENPSHRKTFSRDLHLTAKDLSSKYLEVSDLKSKRGGGPPPAHPERGRTPLGGGPGLESELQEIYERKASVDKTASKTKYSASRDKFESSERFKSHEVGPSLANHRKASGPSCR